MSESGGSLREIAARFGMAFDDKELVNGNKLIESTIGKLQKLGAAFAANEVVGAIREFADAFEEDAGRIDDASQTLGLTAGEFQALGYAATQGGLNAEQATAAWATLNRNIAAAGAGGKAQAAAFSALGVSLKDADGSTRSMRDVVMDLAPALEGIEDPARRASLAQQLLGENGRRLLTIMKDGEGGVAALAAEFEDLGGALSQESIEAAAAYGDEMNRLKVVQDGFRAAIATQVLPILTEVARRTKEWMVEVLKITKNSELAKSAIIALGVAATWTALKMLAAWAPLLIGAASVLAALALLALGIEDITTLVQGGDSAIGRFVERFVGVGAASVLIAALKEAWAGFVLLLHDAVAAAPRVWASLKDGGREVLAWLSNLFGGEGGWFYRIVIRPAVFAMQRIASALGLDQLAARVSAFVQEKRGEWRDLVFNQAPNGQVRSRTGDFASTSANTRTVAAPAGPAAARAANVQQTNSTTINVTGAGDPAAVAREVERRQRDANNANLRTAAGALARER